MATETLVASTPTCQMSVATTQPVTLTEPVTITDYQLEKRDIELVLEFDEALRYVKQTERVVRNALINITYSVDLLTGEKKRGRVTVNPQALSFVDTTAFTRDQMNKFHALVIKYDGMNLQFCVNPSHDNVTSALRRDPRAIRFVSTTNRTDFDSFADVALQKNPHVLGVLIQMFREGELDGDFFTEERILRVLTTNGHTLKYLESFTEDEIAEAKTVMDSSTPGKDREIATYAYKRMLETIGVTERESLGITDVMMNRFRTRAVESHGKAIRYISRPESWMYRIAITQNPFALKFVPDRFQTESMVRNAVECEPMTYRYVSKDLLNSNPDLKKDLKACNFVHKFRHRVVAENFTALEHIPFGQQTREMCKSALGQCLASVQYAEYFGPDVALDAVKYDSSLVKHMSESVITHQVAYVAVSDNSSLWESLPQSVRTKTLLYRLGMNDPTFADPWYLDNLCDM